MSGGKPQMLMCYLCGREFGTRSLPIHVPQCEKKWLSQEAQKPTAEQRPLPARPERLNAILMGVSLKEEERAVFNEEMYNNYDQDVLEKCQWCGRTFNPTAMKSHAKSCTQESPAKPAGTGLTKASLSNTITPGKVFGTRHVGSQNAHVTEMTVDLPGTAGRAQSPKRAQSAKRLSSASASLLPRSGSKGPKKATSGSVTFTTFEQLAPPPATQLATAKGPGMPVVYKDGAYPVRQLVVYSQHGASSPAGPVPKIGVVPGAPAPILVQSAAAVPSAPVPGAGTPRREAASGGGKSFNFCSECGTKFQASAKFCHECGVMRPGSEPCRLKFCHFCGARGSQWNVKTAAPRRL